MTSPSSSFNAAPRLAEPPPVAVRVRSPAELEGVAEGVAVAVGGAEAWRLRPGGDAGGGKGPEPERSHDPRWRWAMLGILSLDICVSYLPYYTFVPILRQGTQVYSVDENALNVLCILYALVYVPGAFFTGPVVGTLGCRWAFALAMGLTTAGCAVRCGPGLLLELFHGTGASLHQDVPLGHFRGIAHTPAALALAPPGAASFAWLLIGQALCALGQPFLVNSTSEMGAEWFPPHERPTAALISNLMNFVGGSLSFMLPPLLVEEQDHLDVAERQLARLLRLQLVISAATFFVTLLLYQPAPHSRSFLAAKREPVPFFAEVKGILALRDFWLVNGYFTVYVGLCHAFDAVEGSLLERYGYSAALASSTGISCGVASIAISVLESRYLVDASSYKPALAVSSLALVVSLLMAFVCLQFRMHSGMFVIAIGVFGLSVPAWGCSCELSSEVCYPAREATVNSILEACSNLGGVATIIATQHLLDQGYGAGVLLLMALAALGGASFLAGTSGRLRRSEAEAAAAAAGEIEMQAAGEAPAGPAADDDAPGSPEKAKPPMLASTRRKIGKALLSVVSTVMLFRFLLLIPESQLPEDFAESLTEAAAVDNRTQRLTKSRPAGFLANGLPEPRSFVLDCSRNKSRMARFQKHMEEAEVPFTTVPCPDATVKDVNDAVRDGLLSERARRAMKGVTSMGVERAGLLAVAIAHLRVLKMVAEGGGEEPTLANIFDVNELVLPEFRKRRNLLLGRLPPDLDLVKLNVLRPAGVKLSLGNSSDWLHRKVFRMRPRTSPLINLGLSNYVVSRHGAQKILSIGRSYDTFGAWELFDIHMNFHLYGAGSPGGLQGFSVATDLLSTHCDSTRLCNRATGHARAKPAMTLGCRGADWVHPLCRES